MFISWFDYFFTYSGGNKGLLGLLNAIELIMETGFAVTAFVTLFLNLILPEEMEDEEIPELTANHADDEGDREEWEKINKSKANVDEEAKVSGTQEVSTSTTKQD